MAATALSLNEYDPVHVNAMVPEENFATDDEETAIMKYDKLAGWKLALVVFAAMITPVETASPFDRDDQCLKADDPEEVYEMTDLFWFGLVILSSWILIGLMFRWLGYRSGRNHILQFRHVRSDRLGRLNAEARLQLALVEKENRHLQDELQLSDVRVAELISLRELGKDVMRRASDEIQEHQLTCPRSQQICVAPVAGRVWHAYSRCSHLNCAHRVDELPQCLYCADGPLLNVANSSGTTLVEDMREWLGMAAEAVQSARLFLESLSRVSCIPCT